MLNVDILPTQNFRRSFRRHVLLATRIRIAVPFVGDVPGYGTLVDFVRILLQGNQTSMELITRPPDTDSGTITEQAAEAIMALGVELLIRSDPRLHSKVYQITLKNGKRAAYVGSANLSVGGFQKNDETMVLLLSENENRKVENELNRLAGSGAFEYGQWKAYKNRLTRYHR